MVGNNTKTELYVTALAVAMKMHDREVNLSWRLYGNLN